MTRATNITFTLLIKITNRLREFNFRQRPDLNYDTDTNDERGNRYIFRMENEEGAWKIKGQNLPDWLLESEALIHTALENHE